MSTASFKPATAADEQTLASLLPAGQITDISQLPSSIPSYLIQVIPELKINGQVVMTGSAVQMGTDHKVKYTINYPDGRIGGYSSNFIAGEFHAVGVVGGSISKNKFTNLQARVSQLQTDIYTDVTANVNKESVLGDIFYAGVQGYFYQYKDMVDVQSRQAVSHLLLPSIGTYGASAKVRYFFGFPRYMSMKQITMDIGNLAYVVTDYSANKANRLAFIRNSGMVSSMLEHMIPEQMFSTPSEPTQAVSTMKLLGTAASQNMPVYTINRANSAQISPQLTLSAFAMREIQRSVAVGKEVIAHQGQLTINGWTGEGYVVTDLVTGDAAYRISGGANGGSLSLTAVGTLIQLRSLYFLLFLGDINGGYSKFLGPIGVVLNSIVTLIQAVSSCTSGFARFNIGAFLALSVFATITIFTFGAGAALAGLTAMLYGVIFGVAIDKGLQSLRKSYGC